MISALSGGARKSFPLFRLDQAIAAVVVDDQIEDEALEVPNVLELHRLEVRPRRVHCPGEGVGLFHAANVLLFNDVLKGHPDAQVKHVAWNTPSQDNKTKDQNK